MTLSYSREEAKAQFKRALEESYTIKMIVFGGEPICDTIFQQAQIRAAAHPARRVIRVDDPTILTEAEVKLYRQSDANNAICVLNVDGEPVCYLTQAQATSFVRLERAFNIAQQHAGK